MPVSVLLESDTSETFSSQLFNSSTDANSLLFRACRAFMLAGAHIFPPACETESLFQTLHSHTQRLGSCFDRGLRHDCSCLHVAVGSEDLGSRKGQMPYVR